MPGDGCAGAAFDVGGRSGDGPGRSDAAEERADDIGQALGHEFLIGIVAVIDHAVGDHGAEQRFDGREQSNRHRGLEQVLDIVPGKLRDVRSGQAVRNAAEPAADCLDRQIEQRHRDRSEHQRTIEPGTRRCHFLGQAKMMAREAAARPRVGQWIVPRCSASTFILLDEIRRHVVHAASPRKSLICVLKISTAMPLVNPIVTGYGMYLIIVPMRAAPMVKQKASRHNRADHQVVEAVLCADAGENDDEGTGRAADGHFRAAQRRK